MEGKARIGHRINCQFFACVWWDEVLLSDCQSALARPARRSWLESWECRTKSRLFGSQKPRDLRCTRSHPTSTSDAWHWFNVGLKFKILYVVMKHAGTSSCDAGMNRKTTKTTRQWPRRCILRVFSHCMPFCSGATGGCGRRCPKTCDG